MHTFDSSSRKISFRFSTNEKSFFIRFSIKTRHLITYRQGIAEAKRRERRLLHSGCCRIRKNITRFLSPFYFYFLRRVQNDDEGKLVTNNNKKTNKKRKLSGWMSSSVHIFMSKRKKQNWSETTTTMESVRENVLSVFSFLIFAV